MENKRDIDVVDLTSKEQTSEFPRKNQRKARESSGLHK